MIGALALVAVTGPLAACGSDDSGSDDGEDTSTAETTESETADASPSAEEGAASGDFKAPAWAKPTYETGKKLITIQAGDISVDVYDAGTAKAPKDGNVVDNKTKKPLIVKGDDLLFLNYVITNNGSSPVDLEEDDVEVDAKWDDWAYLGGMPGITDNELYTKFKINGGDESDMADFTKYDPDQPMPLAPGETVSYGTNFKNQPGHQLTLEVEVGDAEPVEKSVKVG
ncbi:hypothetical protein J2S40_003261 [Nocardioides luteus]|uniref:hypothetical protein n=1 Tax=Nocardioides luteus TaxID=1844 RepID=UPI0016667945|nr:hypothetical protein [Nocardioides luteus]MDR7312203.1 hypothetical protein [Nocardioides luteus]